MSRILAIAINTFREAVRDKVLYGVVGFSTAILLFSLVLGELSLDQRQRVVADVGVASISFFSVVVAVFLGSSLLYKEIERKTLYVILPKPIERWEFLVGKFFGIVFTGIAFVAIMGAAELWIAGLEVGIANAIVGLGLGATVFALAIGAYALRDPSSVIVPWSLVAFAIAAACVSRSEVELAPIVAQLVLIVVELMVVAAVALLFSSFSTPFLTGAFTFGVWLVGRSADSMIRMPGRTLPAEIKSVLAALAWVVPNDELFYPGHHALVTEIASHGGPWSYVAHAAGYGLAYSVVVLALASAVFERRDFA